MRCTGIDELRGPGAVALDKSAGMSSIVQEAVVILEKAIVLRQTGKPIALS